MMIHGNLISHPLVGIISQMAKGFLDNLAADHRMLFHLFKLFIGKLAGLL